MTRLYFLSDGDGPVRYVGKTVQTLEARLSSHRSTARRRDDHRARWVRSAADLRINLIDEVSGDGCAEEIALIASLKSLGARLTNCTRGGEGASGRVPSAETRERIRSKLIGRKGPAKSAETRAKLSTANKGRKKSPESIEKHRQALLGRKNGPMNESQKGNISRSKTKITDLILNTARELVMLGWSKQRVADHLGFSQSQISARLLGRKNWRRP